MWTAESSLLLENVSQYRNSLFGDDLNQRIRLL